VLRPFDAAANEGEPIAVEEHHADARPIRKIFEAHGKRTVN
jgi:hypothetical protein